MKISEMVKQAHKNAKEKGFWNDWIAIYNSYSEVSDIEPMLNNAIAARLALIHSEVSEALEALRVEDMDNFAEELADVVIRVADLAGGLEIDLGDEIVKKMEKNKVRGYMHNKRL